jgi:hypothetical protein
VNPEVLFVSLVCSHTQAPSVGRFVLSGSSYLLVGASRQRPGSVIPSDHQQQHIEAQFGTAPGYTGCPGCGADGYVRCGQCHGLGCWDRSWEMFHCPRCGNSGPITGTISDLSDLGTG